MTLKSFPARIKAATLGTLALVLSACAATQGADDNPILRKFQWFSYLEGGDFKASCGLGAPSRYRMVYNAVYSEQVRIYEFSDETSSLRTRVLTPPNFQSFSIESLSGFLNPWRGKVVETPLTASDRDGLVQDLKASGVFGSANVGAELSSKGFFWTVAACHNGVYHFTGFAWPSQAWTRARFTGRLFALDPTGIAINKPRQTDTTRTLQYPYQNPHRHKPDYHIKVGKNGLAG